MKSSTIHQIIEFNASPENVYEMIMDESLHSDLSGGHVTMSKEINGEFSVFEGYCTGHNIELVPGEKIVQAWHFQEDGWPDEHYSTCTFIFKPSPKGCILDFTQTDIPEHKTEALAQGWENFYWEPMREYFESI
jgi:activator of HSP90 ATPase